jgi:hypothetical protein
MSSMRWHRYLYPIGIVTYGYLRDNGLAGEPCGAFLPFVSTMRRAAGQDVKILSKVASRSRHSISTASLMSSLCEFHPLYFSSVA